MKNIINSKRNEKRNVKKKEMNNKNESNGVNFKHFVKIIIKVISLFFERQTRLANS